MRSLFALLLGLSLVAASCGGSDLSAEGDGSATTVDPASLPEDTVLFDEESGGGSGSRQAGDSDDAESGETADATALTTTSTAPPTPAESPSVVIYRYGVVGGWSGSEWIDGFAESAAEVGTEAGDVFQLAGIGVDAGTVTGGEPLLICDPAGGYGVETTPEIVHEGFAGAIGIGVLADWDPNPRTAQINSGGDVYVAEVERLLSQNGIDPGLAIVDSVARVDLEGDGVDEVVVTANYAPDMPTPHAGNYSLVLLRKLVEDEVQTSILFDEYLAEEPEDFFWVQGKLAGFADLNGDAKLEILLRTQYYEGGGIEAYEYVNDDLGAMLVMSTGCGA